MVDGIFLGEDQLGDGHKGVALLGQLLQDAGQGLGGVKGRVVEENDGPGAHLAHHPLLDLGGGDLFPVQTIHVPNRFNPLCHKGLRQIFLSSLANLLSILLSSHFSSNY